MGNVRGPYMIGMECVNEKLFHRAQTILNRLYGLNEEEAVKLLIAHDNNLRKTLKELE